MNFAIILSGGIGSRMKTNGIPKQYIKVNKKPILIYTLETFQKSKDIDKIVIVANIDWHETITIWCENYRISKFSGFASSGTTRQESIIKGLDVCMSKMETCKDKVIIHDAVRPLITSKLINQCLNALDTYEGCMPILPVKDTIYVSENGKKISSLLNRDVLYCGQAPEAFILKKYFEINSNINKEELKTIRGTTEIAYKNNLKICLIEGDETNFKITTPMDLQKFKNIVGEEHESI